MIYGIAVSFYPLLARGLLMSRAATSRAEPRSANLAMADSPLLANGRSSADDVR